MGVAIIGRVRDRIECMRVRRLIPLFLDGELDAAQRQLVVRHLEACRRCGLAAATYRSLRQRLSGLGQPPDDDAVARLIDFVDHLVDDDAPPDGASVDGP